MQNRNYLSEIIFPHWLLVTKTVCTKFRRMGRVKPLPFTCKKSSFVISIISQFEQLFWSSMWRDRKRKCVVRQVTWTLLAGLKTWRHTHHSLSVFFPFVHWTSPLGCCFQARHTPDPVRDRAPRFRNGTWTKFWEAQGKQGHCSVAKILMNHKGEEIALCSDSCKNNLLSSLLIIRGLKTWCNGPPEPPCSHGLPGSPVPGWQRNQIKSEPKVVALSPNCWQMENGSYMNALSCVSTIKTSDWPMKDGEGSSGSH